MTRKREGDDEGSLRISRQLRISTPGGAAEEGAETQEQGWTSGHTDQFRRCTLVQASHTAKKEPDEAKKDGQHKKIRTLL